VKSKVGIICIILGVLLLSGALLLAVFNRRQDAAARDAAAKIMARMGQEIQENSAGELQIPPELLTDEDKKMTEVEIDGYAYIGYLSIPNLGLELPVMSSWSYSQLRRAPCRYSGSVRGEDLVLMAHNYKNHFGRISRLNLNDSVSFTDMDGITTHYKVAALDILESTAVETMTAGEFDLTLFTCTPGGTMRYCVRCGRVS
jgi:sortase A